MRTRVVLLQRLWGLVQRDLLPETELVYEFVDRLDVENLACEWKLLPAGYQEVIQRYFRTTSPHQMPRVCLFGHPSSEAIERLTTDRQEKAMRLVHFLSLADRL